MHCSPYISWHRRTTSPVKGNVKHPCHGETVINLNAVSPAAARVQVTEPAGFVRGRTQLICLGAQWTGGAATSSMHRLLQMPGPLQVKAGVDR